MPDLSQRWPLGLGARRWWLTATAVVVLLALALTFDHTILLWALNWPESIRGALEQITRYGESDWILFPAGALYLLTAVVALVVRWKLMRTLLWQFASLYGFIFVGVGLPSLVATLAKRAIGRGRPEHFDQSGLFGFTPNLGDWTFQSFPSGHATTAFALAAVIGFVSPRWYYPSLVFAAAIAVSRVTLGLHYASDVLAGAILGLVGAYFVRIVFAKRRWMFEPAQSGAIRPRAMSSLRRYLALKRRDTARALLPNRP